MNKLKENRQTLDNAEMLIRMQNEYINKLRNIVGRYYCRHGRMIKSDEFNLADEVDFEINGDDKSTFIEVIDFNRLGIKSNFQQIQELNNKLGL